MKFAVVTFAVLATLSLGLVVIHSAVPTITAQDDPSVALLGPTGDELVEGRDYRIRWTAAGVETITVTASGDTIPLPLTTHRFSLTIAENLPVERRQVEWSVPFVDALKLKVTVKGYHRNGMLAARADKVYSFRPDALKDRKEDGIYIDLRDDNRQRLYVLKNNRVEMAGLTSAAPRSLIFPRNVHPDVSHDHEGVFHVIAKYPMWYSKQFNRDMPWSLNYWNGHFIHATGPDFYGELGTAASHGCDRLTLGVAKKLYDETSVGRRVEVIVK